MHVAKVVVCWLIISWLGAAIEGCSSSPDRIILLPNADGSPSALIVKTASGERIIDHPYQAASISKNGTFTRGEETPESVRARYGRALDAQPKRPVSYIIYFVSGKNEITAESQVVVNQLKAELKTRGAPEIVVIGHTDRVGKVEDNDTLSLERAKVMRDILIVEGIPAEHIEAAGRGEREPLVQTADEVAEPRNRRVEINIR
jgi:outer membrane protein OmpA-like peptidoglycan-associated protein